MSSDRLREAADRLDDNDPHGQRDWPEHDLCRCGEDWNADHRKDRAAAALLRAVATDLNSTRKAPSDALAAAALALADEILGEER